jgi:hypothetical protein
LKGHQPCLGLSQQQFRERLVWFLPTAAADVLNNLYGDAAERRVHVEYVAQDAHWFQSVHLHASAVMVQRDLVVITELQDLVDVYSCSGGWKAVPGSSLGALMEAQSPDSPIIVLFLSGHGNRRHFEATRSLCEAKDPYA